MIELDDKTLKKFEQELKKFNRLSSDDRPVLQELHYHENGNLEVTNSHVAIRLVNVHDEDDSSEEYPKLDGIFDGLLQYDNEVTMPVDVLKNAAGAFKTDKQEAMKVTITKEYLALDSILEDGVPYIGAIVVEDDFEVEEEFSFGVNPEYLYNAMMFLGKFGIKDVTMKYGSAVRPVIFVHENLEYVIVPIRMKDK